MGRYKTETELINECTRTWSADKKYSFLKEFYKNRRNPYVNFVFILLLGVFCGQRFYMKDNCSFVYLTLFILAVGGFFFLKNYLGVSLILSSLSFLLLMPNLVRSTYDLMTFKATVANYNERLSISLFERLKYKKKQA